MKKIFSTITAFVLALSVIAQAPLKMSYQAVIRDADKGLVSNHAIGMRISILMGSASGTVVYSETITSTTNINGLVTIEIGGGAGFDAINWENGPYFIKTETDPSGGSNYTIIGTSQFLSVPYALHAKTATSYAETDPVFLSHPSYGITEANITNWNAAFSWGNHAGLYRPLSYVPDWTEITGKPTLATIATSGNYNDLINNPILFDGAWTSLTGKPVFANVATSGSYSDLLDKPAGNNNGDMQYWDGAAWVVIPAGSPGQFLQLSASRIPVWAGSTYPTLTTSAASSITNVSATSGGNISSDGGAPVTARGVCWSSTTSPTIANNKSSDGSGTGTFTSAITGLATGITYYVKAYATNRLGTAYGNEVSLTTTGDVVAPVPGNTGLLTVGAATAYTVTLNWTQATDNFNNQSSLAYRVFYSTSNNINTLNNCITNGTPGSAWTTAISTFQVTGLSSGIVYYFNVLVKDQSGNVAAYTSILKNPEILIVLVNGARQWSNGTYALCAKEYRNPPDGYDYAGDTGDGLYKIKPGSTPFNAYCDMTTDGGGWTMVGNLNNPSNYEDYMFARSDASYGTGMADPNSATSWTDWQVLSGAIWPIEFAVILDQPVFTSSWENYAAKVVYRVSNRWVMPNYGTGQDLTSGDNLYYKFNFTTGWSDVGSSSSSGWYYWWPYNVSNGDMLIAFHYMYGYTAYYGSGVPGGNNTWYHHARMFIR